MEVQQALQSSVTSVCPLATQLPGLLTGRTVSLLRGEMQPFLPDHYYVLFYSNLLEQVGGVQGGLGREQTPCVPWDARARLTGRSTAEPAKVLEEV